jgi:Flp pilus assembly protein TadB
MSEKKNKGNRAVIGGSAVPGAKSTQPKQYTENANPQQQQLESYNREMRRRMERLNSNDDDQRVQSIQSQRKKRAERLKQRRQQQLAQVRRSLPGGKVDTNINKVFIFVGIVVALVIIIIVLALLLRH